MSGINFTGALQAFQGGVQAGNNLLDADRRRQVHDIQMDTAQLGNERARTELAEYQQTSDHRQTLRQNKEALLSERLKSAGLANDEAVFKNFLTSAKHFKPGDQVPSQVVEAANNLGVNMSALTGTRYQRHRLAMAGLMNGELERNSPEVLNYLNELAVPLLNRRPHQSSDLELEEITRMEPDQSGKAMMLMGRWKNRKTGETRTAPVTVDGSADDGAQVRGFSIEGLMNWAQSMDYMARQVNENPNLSKAVGEMRDAFSPQKGRYGNLQFDQRIGAYQLGPDGQINTIKTAGLGAQGAGPGGLKASDWLDRDKAVRDQMEALLPEGTNPRIAAAMIGRAQQLDRATGGKFGPGDLVNQALQAAGDAPMTAEQAAYRAVQEAQTQLEKDPDAFDGFWGFHDEETQQQWIAQRAQELMQQAPGVVNSRLQQGGVQSTGNAGNGQMLATIQQRYPNASPEDQQRILQQYQSMGQAQPNASAVAGNADPTPRSEATSQGLNPQTMAEAVALIADENPALTDTEVENLAAKTYPDAFTRKHTASRSAATGGVRQVGAEDNALLSDFFNSGGVTRHGRMPKRNKKPKDALQTEILSDIDGKTGMLKKQMDQAQSAQVQRSMRGKNQDVSPYKQYREQFNALKKYRSAINDRKRPSAELARKVMDLLPAGRAKEQARLLASQGGVKA